MSDQEKSKNPSKAEFFNFQILSEVLQHVFAECVHGGSGNYEIN